MLLVDAYNVVRAQWVLPPARRGIDVGGLVRLIGRSRFAGRRLRVVVDGRPGPEFLRHGVFDTLGGPSWTRLGRAEVVFSGREREADDVIEEILERTRGVAITVVSSDRRLIRAAGLAGADQIGNGSFLRLINEDLDREAAEAVPAFAAEVPLDRYSVAHWMREFGFDPGEVGGTAEPTPEPPLQPPPRPKPGKDKPASAPKRGDSFGSTLGVSLPAPGEVPASPVPPVPAGVARAGLPPEHESLDPMLRDAFEEWYGSLHIGDLDMRKWVDGVEPL